MKFPFFASFLIICALLAYERWKHTRKQKKIEEEFWEKELAANNVRKRSLAGLDYIKVPEDLVDEQLLDLPEYKDKCRIIRELQEKTIVNLTGQSNTDLKLQYGTANITVLTEYDQNYTLLVSTLQELGRMLYDKGLVDEATKLLEYAISIGTDVSLTYYLLADIYYQAGTPERVNELIDAAKQIRGMMREPILKHLCEDPLFAPVVEQVSSKRKRRR